MKDGLGRNALLLAIRSRSLKTVEFLLENEVAFHPLYRYECSDEMKDFINKHISKESDVTNSHISKTPK